MYSLYTYIQCNIQSFHSMVMARQIYVVQTPAYQATTICQISLIDFQLYLLSIRFNFEKKYILKESDVLAYVHLHKIAVYEYIHKKFSLLYHIKYCCLNFTIHNGYDMNRITQKLCLYCYAQVIKLSRLFF